MTGEATDHGRVYFGTVTCQTGYELVGKQLIKCMNGIWSAEYPVCTRKSQRNQCHPPATFLIRFLYEIDLIQKLTCCEIQILKVTLLATYLFRFLYEINLMQLKYTSNSKPVTFRDIN